MRQLTNGVEPLIYSYALSIERPFHTVEYVDALRDWSRNNFHVLLLIPAAYVILVLAGREFMKSRSRYELKLPLILWNILLATFSITGSIRVLPGMQIENVFLIKIFLLNLHFI